MMLCMDISGSFLPLVVHVYNYNSHRLKLANEGEIANSFRNLCKDVQSNPLADTVFKAKKSRPELLP